MELHRKRGTYRKDRHGRGSLVAAQPVDRAGLGLSAAEALERVLGEGISWLAQTDAVRLVLLREQFEEREALRDSVLAGTGDRHQLRELDKAIAEGLTACGLDASARSRLGLAEVRTRSKLEEIRDRRSERNRP